MTTYGHAINMALRDEMRSDESVFAYGIGVNTDGVFGTTLGLAGEFGEGRCIETPICEDALTGVALGAALAGQKPVLVHMRADFALRGMDQLVNVIAGYRQSTGGRRPVPITIRMVVGRGWGQGWQHSKSLHGMLSHIPGVNVYAPVTPSDAYHFTRRAIQDPDPVILLEHRWLYWAEGDVPGGGEDRYDIGFSVREVYGKDICIIATSWMVIESLLAAKILHDQCGIDCTVLSLDRLSTFTDKQILGIIDYVDESDGNVVIADNDWGVGGLATSLLGLISTGTRIESRATVGWPFFQCPTARRLENDFYPNAESIVCAICHGRREVPDLSDIDFYSHENVFRGPF